MTGFGREETKDSEETEDAEDSDESTKETEESEETDKHTFDSTDGSIFDISHSIFAALS